MALQKKQVEIPLVGSIHKEINERLLPEGKALAMARNVYPAKQGELRQIPGANSLGQVLVSSQEIGGNNNRITDGFGLYIDQHDRLIVNGMANDYAYDEVPVATRRNDATAKEFDAVTAIWGEMGLEDNPNRATFLPMQMDDAALYVRTTDGARSIQAFAATSRYIFVAVDIEAPVTANASVHLVVYDRVTGAEVYTEQIAAHVGTYVVGTAPSQTAVYGSINVSQVRLAAGYDDAAPLGYARAHKCVVVYTTATSGNTTIASYKITINEADGTISKDTVAGSFPTVLAAWGFDMVDVYPQTEWASGPSDIRAYMAIARDVAGFVNIEHWTLRPTGGWTLDHTHVTNTPVAGLPTSPLVILDNLQQQGAVGGAFPRAWDVVFRPNAVGGTLCGDPRLDSVSFWTQDAASMAVFDESGQTKFLDLPATVQQFSVAAVELASRPIGDLQICQIAGVSFESHRRSGTQTVASISIVFALHSSIPTGGDKCAVMLCWDGIGSLGAFRIHLPYGMMDLYSNDTPYRYLLSRTVAPAGQTEKWPVSFAKESVLNQSGSVSAPWQEDVAFSTKGPIRLLGWNAGGGSGFPLAIWGAGMQPYLEGSSILFPTIQQLSGSDGAKLHVAKIKPRAKLPYVPSDSEVVVGGGQLWHLGSKTAPNSLRPPALMTTVTPPGASTVPTGTYRFAAVNVRLLPNGELQRSAPTYAEAVINTLGETLYVTVLPMWGDLRAANLTNSGEQWTELYLEDSGNYRRVNETLFLPEDYIGTEITFAVDPTIRFASFGESLYTNGGIFPNDVEPPLRHMTRTPSRLFGISAIDARELWYTKTKSIGDAWAFSASFVLLFPEKLTAVANLDGRVVAFAERAIYTFGGPGPNAAGVGSFSQPEKLAGSFGCVDWKSVIETGAGVFFLSDRGYALLDRSLSVKLIGDPIRGLEESPVQAVYVPELDLVVVPQKAGPSDNTPSDQLVFSTDSATMGWFIWSPYSDPSPAAATWLADVVAGRDRLYYLDSQGVTYEVVEGLSDGLTILTRDVELETGWIRLEGMTDYHRVYRLLLFGQVLGEADITVQVAKDYDDTVVETFTFTGATVAGYPTALFMLKPKYQKCHSIKLTITTAAPESGQTEGFVFHALSVIYGTKATKRPTTYNMLPS